ncbi:MAG TPA: 30S ribosomal protein S11 [Lentisphaeria bacterium]|nr:30S ribosomal protein S11 [Lentisphaeria bacterium]
MADETTDVQVTAPEAASAPASAPEAKRPKIKGGRQVMSGIVHVDSTFNNTRVSISDQQGNVLAWSTGGKLGYKGSRKSTAYVAQLIAVDAAKKAMATYGLREVEVRIKGPGAGRESAVRGIASAGLEITSLRDITPLPHNGCRPPKRRRV